MAREQPPPSSRDDDTAESWAPSEARSRPPRWPLASYAILALSAAAILAGGGYWLVSRPDPPAVEVILPTPAPAVVHVAGAVRSPGVYSLPKGSRVADAVASAGGAIAGADLNALNLAAVVVDGQRIEVPGGLASPISQQASAADGLLDLNLASAAQLEELPSIGETRACAIVEWRATHGPFTSVDDLLEIPGIGTVTVEAIRPLVTAR